MAFRSHVVQDLPRLVERSRSQSLRDWFLLRSVLILGNVSLVKISKNLMVALLKKYDLVKIAVLMRFRFVRLA